MSLFSRTVPQCFALMGIMIQVHANLFRFPVDALHVSSNAVSYGQPGYIHWTPTVEKIEWDFGEANVLKLANTHGCSVTFEYDAKGKYTAKIVKGAQTLSVIRRCIVHQDDKSVYFLDNGSNYAWQLKFENEGIAELINFYLKKILPFSDKEYQIDIFQKGTKALGVDSEKRIIMLCLNDNQTAVTAYRSDLTTPRWKVDAKRRYKYDEDGKQTGVGWGNGRSSEDEDREEKYESVTSSNTYMIWGPNSNVKAKLKKFAGKRRRLTGQSIISRLLRETRRAEQA